MKPHFRTWQPVFVMLMAMLAAGCNIMADYRPAEIRTIQDFSEDNGYRKQIGVMALTNTTRVISDQTAEPLMESFLAGMAGAAKDAQLVVPGQADAPSFLAHPPRLPSGEVDALAFSALARQAGMSGVASLVLMDVHAYKEAHGLWIFRRVSHHVRIQVAAVAYDAITGSRLAFDVLTEDILVEEQVVDSINAGQAVQIPELGEAFSKMGAELGERMGERIAAARWTTSVIAVENGACIIPAGSRLGIAVGDRFAVLDTSEVAAGWNGQQYIVPGVETGKLRVIQVTADQSVCAPEAERDTPPVGSIVVPET